MAKEVSQNEKIELDRFKSIIFFMFLEVYIYLWRELWKDVAGICPKSILYANISDPLLQVQAVLNPPYFIL